MPAIDLLAPISGVFLMKPSRPGRASGDLFRERLDAIIDMRHPLVRLGELMPWADFDECFGRFYKPIGRPAKPTRLMVGLHYLKHTYDLSDEETVDRWVENPYWQVFCGFEFFQHDLPIDPSLMTRWRGRVGPEAMEEVLKASVAVALETKTVKRSSLERVTVDTTVQPKAIAHPTDSRLYLKALLLLVRQARKAGIKLRQSHTRLAKRAALKAGRYAHAKQFKRLRRELKRLRIYLGRVFRDVSRKIAGDGELEARLARLLGLVERLLAQQPKDKMKLYSLHAPEVVCIAKGKAHKPYEFGCKVGIAATNREGLFLAAPAFEGNPYDGHTLRATAAQAEAMTGVKIKRIYADKGYRGHDYDGKAKVMLCGHTRGLTPTMKRELKRRSAIEPMIGHAKCDGRLGQNWLLGPEGDKINALLAAAGHNLRLILRRLMLLFARILGAVARILAPRAPIRALSAGQSAFADTWFGPGRPAASMA
jgi:IS5 family transposase